MSEVRASKETCSVYVPRSYAGSKIVPLPWCGSGFAGMVTLFAGIKKALSQSHCRPLTLSLARDLRRVSRTSYSEHLACITTRSACFSQ